MNLSKTSYFILPILELKGDLNALIKDGLINSYLGWRKHLDDTYGEYLYVLFDNNLAPGTRIQELDNHPMLIESMITGDGDSTVFIFNLNEDFKEKVIRPFTSGKYSQISRKFVEELHPVIVNEGPFSYGKNKVRQVLDKSPEIREEWEEILDTKIPEEAEVWSIPSKEEEILDYLETDQVEDLDRTIKQ
jgi:hypothetical protein